MKQFRRAAFPKELIAIIAFVIVVSAIGVGLQLAGKAAGPFVAAEPEQGTLTSPAATISDSLASNNSAVIFAPVSTGTLMGWQLTTTNIGLAPFGLNCSSLPLYTGSMSPAAGTFISQKRIVGELNASAGNITVEKSCFQPAATNGAMKGILNTQVCSCCDCWTPNAGTVVRDSEFDATLITAQAAAGTCAMVGMATLERNYMHGMGSGICYFGTGTDGSAVAENNYVTDLRSYGESHNEAGTVRDFVKNASNTRYIRWIGNRLFCDGNVTAGLFIQPTWSDIHNIWVTNNYIEGGGYNLYSSGGQTGAHIGNAHATNNRFRSTGWGPAVVDNVEGWVEWSENYRYDPTKLDAKGAIVPNP